jgi:hypothetical protein
MTEINPTTMSGVGLKTGIKCRGVFRGNEGCGRSEGQNSPKIVIINLKKKTFSVLNII